MAAVPSSTYACSLPIVFLSVDSEFSLQCGPHHSTTAFPILKSHQPHHTISSTPKSPPSARCVFVTHISDVVFAIHSASCFNANEKWFMLIKELMYCWRGHISSWGPLPEPEPAQAPHYSLTSLVPFPDSLACDCAQYQSLCATPIIWGLSFNEGVRTYGVLQSSNPKLTHPHPHDFPCLAECAKTFYDTSTLNNGPVVICLKPSRFLLYGTANHWQPHHQWMD